MDHILIIDDDTNINNLLREALEKGSYTCSQAYSGTEALLRLDTLSRRYVPNRCLLPR